MIVTKYLQSVYYKRSFKATVDKAVKTLKRFKKTKNFDTIVFTGNSGAALAYILSYKMNVDITCIRKGKNNHFKEDIEGRSTFNKYIIVDDMIDTGATMNRMINRIKKQNSKAKLVGIYLYDDCSDVVGNDFGNLMIK